MKTFYLIEKRYYTTNEEIESYEYYVMPYSLIGTLKALGFWQVVKMFINGRAYFTEGMATHNAKYNSNF